MCNVLMILSLTKSKLCSSAIEGLVGLASHPFHREEGAGWRDLGLVSSTHAVAVVKRDAHITKGSPCH